MMNFIKAFAIFILTSSCAWAQSSPNLIYGQVPTAAQWNSYFAAKQNTLGFNPINKAGDVMLGRLVTAADGAYGAGFNLPHGNFPSPLRNGDLFSTTDGVWARINNVTVGPFVGASTTSFGATAPLAVAFPSGIVTYSITGVAGKVLAGASPSFTSTPVLGVAGSALGSVGFQNLTSGTITLAPVAGALGVVTLSLPAATDTLVGKSTTDTLANKTLTAPVINGGTHTAITSFGLRSTGAAFDLAFATSEVLTGNRAVSWVIGDQPRTISLNGNVTTASDFNTSGAFSITLTATGTTNVILPTTGTLATLNGVQTLTQTTLQNGTLTGTTNLTTLRFSNATSGAVTLQTITGALGTVTLSLPAATDTLVGKSTTDTLTNKTFDTAGTGNSFSINGVAATANTGTGAVARAVSPAFTTPNIGAATATTINGNAWTAGTGTLTIAAGKTLTASNTLIFAGTDGNTFTFPSGSATVATLTAVQTLTQTTAQNLALTGTVSGDNTVPLSILKQIAGLSVVGVTGSATANNAAITGTASQFLGINSGGTALAFQTMAGDVTLSGATATIGSNIVTYAKFQQVAASSLVGNATGSLANATGITLGSTLVFSGSVLQTAAHTGDVTTSANSFATTVAANAVTYAKFQQVAASSLVGNATGSLANAAGITLGATLSFSGTTLLCTTGTTSQLGCLRPDGTTITVSAGVITAVGAAATSVAIGTTTITSGTDTRILRNNAGVLGEYTITGTGTIVAMAASPTFTGTITAAAANFSGAVAITSTSANSLAVGPSGTTNPTLQVDGSTASAATGLKIKSAAAAGGLALSVITSGTNENLKLDAAGSGTITLGNVSTGAITLSRATTLSAALTYGGVALSNAVTGTGNMVLSADQTLTGTMTAAIANFSGLVTASLGLNATGARSVVASANDTFGLAIRYVSSTGSAYIGATNSATPDLLFSNSGAAPLVTMKNSTVVQFNGYGAGALSTDASGNISATSDETLKNIHGRFKLGTSALVNIKPILFSWNEESGLETKESYVGFSAQNVRQSIPEAIGMMRNGKLTLQDRAIVAALVNSAQEMNARIIRLEDCLSKKQVALCQ